MAMAALPMQHNNVKQCQCRAMAAMSLQHNDNGMTRHDNGSTANAAQPQCQAMPLQNEQWQQCQCSTLLSPSARSMNECIAMAALLMQHSARLISNDKA